MKDKVWTWGPHNTHISRHGPGRSVNRQYEVHDGEVLERGELWLRRFGHRECLQASGALAMLILFLTRYSNRSLTA